LDFVDLELPVNTVAAAAHAAAAVEVVVVVAAAVEHSTADTERKIYF
jgi:hypothetical protein